MTTTLSHNGQAPDTPAPADSERTYRNRLRRGARRRHRATDALMRLLTDHERLTAQEAAALRLANNTRPSHLPPYQDVEQIASRLLVVEAFAGRLVRAAADSGIRLENLGGCGRLDCPGCALADLADLLNGPTRTKEHT